MKRTLSLLLCAAMLLSALVVFAACQQGLVSTITANDAKAQTLVLAAIKDEKTTPDAIERVENALNAITTAKYNTKIILKLFTADEYAEKIMGMFDSYKSYQSALEGDEGTNEEYDRYKGMDRNGRTVEENGDLTYKDEFGRIITVYPDVREDQLDIVFVDSLATYKKLLEKKYIIALDEDLNSNGAMRKFMSGAFFNQINLIGDLKTERNMTYAIPNNYVARNYRYLLVNKKLYDYYGYDTSLDLVATDANNGGSGCDDLLDFIYFMREVAQNNDTVADDLKVDRVLYNYSGNQWETYFGDGSGNDTAMVLPTSRTSFANGDVRHFVGSIFSRLLFKKAQAFLYELKTDYNNVPYTGDCFYMASKETTGFAVPTAQYDDNEEKFAVAMISGDADAASYYNKDDYYVIKISSPVLDNQMFNSMFAVSSFSSTAIDNTGRNIVNKIHEYADQVNPRCFEIISMLQTDRDVVNLLTYGVNGDDYDAFEEDEVFHNVGKGGYYPVVGKMGNTFLCNPNDKMDEKTMFYAKNEWSAAKMQNRSLLISPYCGMLLQDFYDEDGEIIREEGVEPQLSAMEIDREITEFYRDAMKKIEEFNGVDESGKKISMEDYISAIDKQFRKTDAFKLATQDFKRETEDYHGPFYQYLPLGQYSAFFKLINDGEVLF